MRLLVLWVVCGGAAALLRWVVAPIVILNAQTDLAASESVGGFSLGPILAAGTTPFFLEWFFPLALLVGAFGITVNVLTSPRKRRG